MKIGHQYRCTCLVELISSITHYVQIFGRSFSQLILYTGSLHLWSLTLSSEVKLQSTEDQHTEKLLALYLRGVNFERISGFLNQFYVFSQNQGAGGPY